MNYYNKYKKYKIKYLNLLMIGGEYEFVADLNIAMTKKRELVRSINYHFDKTDDKIILHTQIILNDGRKIKGICELRESTYINLDRLYVDLSDSKILEKCGIGSFVKNQGFLKKSS